MERVTILGTGTMGHSIAISVAEAKYPVTIYGLNDEEIDQAISGIQQKMTVLIKNQVFNQEEYHSLLEHIRFSKNLQEATEDASIIIEAIPENIELKQNVLQEIERYCQVDTIFASNSFSVPPNMSDKKLDDTEIIVRTHFWKRAHVIPLVEIIRGKKTKDEYIDRIYTFLQRINKQPIMVEKEVVGFIGNRLPFAL